MAEIGLTLSQPGAAFEEEACRVLRLLWTEETASFAGRYYQLADARPAIRPVQRPHPPLWIGGSGDRTLRIAARYADGWSYTGPPELFAETVRRLRGACAQVGRDPATLRVSAQFFLRDRPAAAVRADAEAYMQAGADTLMAVLDRPYTEARIDAAARVLLGS